MSHTPELFIASDHQGFELKNTLRNWMIKEGYSVTDFGPETVDPEDDYPDYGIKVATAVAENPKKRLGIVICASGVGMAVAADKVKGVRAGLIHHPLIAKAAREDDDINVLALGAKFISVSEAIEVVKAWLETPFSGAERHIRRIAKISEYENTAPLR